MSVNEAGRLVDRAVFNDLFRRLRLFWVTGYLEEPGYILGVHVLAKMAKYDSLEIAASWKEFATQHVVSGNEVVVGPVTPVRFGFLGAVQQLHKVVGLLSHIHQDGMTEAIREARENSGVSEHFTKRPGLESDLLGLETLMIFRFEPQFGLDEIKAFELFKLERPQTRLPAWVKPTRAGVKDEGN